MTTRYPGHLHIRPHKSTFKSDDEPYDESGYWVLRTLAMMWCEFLGTLILVFFGTTIAALLATDSLAVGIAFGFVLIGIHESMKMISGGHFNPAVTAGVFALGYMPDGYSLYSFILACLFISSQLCGGIVGSALLNAWGPPSLGITVPTGLSAGSYWLVVLYEFFALAVFVLAFLNTNYRGGPKRLLELMGSFKEKSRSVVANFYVGSTGNSITLGAIFSVLVSAGQLLGTGGSVNFARTLGPAVIANNYTTITAYLVANIFAVIGAVLAHFLCFLAHDLRVWRGFSHMAMHEAHHLTTIGSD